MFGLWLKVISGKAAEGAAAARMGRVGDCHNRPRIQNEGDELGMGVRLAIKEAAEETFALLPEHRKRPAEFVQPLSTQGVRSPAAPHHAAVDRRVPKHSVALFEQAVVRRPAFGGRQFRFIAEAGIEHVGNMHEFVAEKSS